MQQAYQALRVVSEAQTVHIVLATRPGELMLKELGRVCTSLASGSSDGIKAVILDFAEQSSPASAHLPAASELLAQTGEEVRAVPQPVLAVGRASLSEVACRLCALADFVLVAHEAELYLPEQTLDGVQEKKNGTIGGRAALRLGLATWSAPAKDLNREMERILDMLRSKSALALRHAKASMYMARQTSGSPLEALHQINQFYLDNVVRTEDAREGVRAFLEKRPPNWQNR